MKHKHTYIRTSIISFSCVVLVLVVTMVLSHRPTPVARQFDEIAMDTVGETGSELPETFNLDVPFSSQAPEGDWSEPWQNACEEVTLLMLEAYYAGDMLSIDQVKEDVIRMVDWETDAGWFTSIDAADIVTLADRFITLPDGYTFTIVRDPSIDDIKRLIASGHPVFAVADGRALDNPHFTNGGPLYHTLVIKGYTSTEFITNDPGTRHGADFRYPQDHLLSVLHDWNDGDVPHGEPLVLVATKSQ